MKKEFGTSWFPRMGGEGSGKAKNEAKMDVGALWFPKVGLGGGSRRTSTTTGCCGGVFWRCVGKKI